jgi:TRAP-type mannitol/chloroaromatic compound transport system permease small subunit
MSDDMGLNPVLVLVCRFIGIASISLAFIFIFNNFVTHVGGAPGLYRTFGAIGFFGDTTPKGAFSGGMLTIGWLQVLMNIGAIAGAGYYTMSRGSLALDADRLDRLSSFVVRVAFWSVLIIGVADAILSFLRVEGFHIVLFGQEVATKIGLAEWRGKFIHLPLMALAVVIAMRDRSVSVVWLITLVVVAELLIVLASFIFSYEQTFMGDLVRFWYAALFLFAGAYTLKEEGHVRIDVLFSGFQEKTKAWVNATGSVAFGMPLCWLILLLGLSGKSSLINSPVLNFETTMSGFGMYVKYLMAAFLVVFALSMLIQFTSYFFNALARMSSEILPAGKKEA